MPKPEVILLDQTDSTNTWAKERFAQLPDGTVVAAREQRAGRGRMGRRWIVSPGSALTATIVFKQVQQPFHAGCLTGLAGIRCMRSHLTGFPLFFKWPNDLYVWEKKLAGVLSEGIWEKGSFAGAVSGIGINLNQSEKELAALDNPAVSCFSLTGKEVPQEEALEEFSRAAAEVYAAYREDPGKVIQQWIAENRLIGQTLEAIRADGSTLRGKVQAIQPDGALLFCVAGKTERFDCGDIRILPGTIDFDAMFSH